MDDRFAAGVPPRLQMDQEAQHSSQAGGAADPHELSGSAAAAAAAREEGAATSPSSSGGVAGAGTAPSDQPGAPQDGPKESRSDTGNAATVVELLLVKDGENCFVLFPLSFRFVSFRFLVRPRSFPISLLLSSLSLLSFFFSFFFDYLFIYYFFFLSLVYFFRVCRGDFRAKARQADWHHDPRLCVRPRGRTIPLRLP